MTILFREGGEEISFEHCAYSQCLKILGSMLSIKSIKIRIDEGLSVFG